jgi:K+-sensing histidine kinase KdpD
LLKLIFKCFSILEHEMVIIYVEDEWSGLPPSTKEIICDRFYREPLENAEFRIHSGFGLNVS